MGKTLYFGNLPWSVKDQDLADFVQNHASVISARIITDRETGRSKGYGFVEVDEDMAEKIIGTLNGTAFGGRPLSVSEARLKKAVNV